MTLLEYAIGKVPTNIKKWDVVLCKQYINVLKPEKLIYEHCEMRYGVVINILGNKFEVLETSQTQHQNNPYEIEVDFNGKIDYVQCNKIQLCDVHFKWPKTHKDKDKKYHFVKNGNSLIIQNCTVMSGTVQLNNEKKRKIKELYKKYISNRQVQNLNESPSNSVTLYRTGKINEKDYMSFFCDDINYYKDNSDYWEVKSEEINKYELDLTGLKVWDPIIELDLEADNWNTIRGSKDTFKDYDIEYHDFEEEPDSDYGYTDTDYLSEAGMWNDYDIVILRNIPSDHGYGKEYTEYALTPKALKQLHPVGYNTNESGKEYISEDIISAYHGSNKKFNSFDIEFLGSSTDATGFYGNGLYFTNNKEDAKFYGSNIYKVNLTYNKKLEFPFSAPEFKQFYLDNESLFNKYFKVNIAVLDDYCSENRDSYTMVDFLVDFLGNDYEAKLTNVYKELGYDLISIKNGAEYIVFDNNQVEITEVLNESLENIDSKGNKLSSEQIKYFKDSKVRKGNKLLYCYHGSPFKFTSFDSIRGSLNWFTPSEEYAQHYSNKGKDGVIMPFYVNIENMLELGSIDEITITDYYDDYMGDNYPYATNGDPFSKEFIKICKQLGIKGEKALRQFVEVCGVDNIDYISTLTNTEEFKGALATSDFDGVHAVENGIYDTYAILNSNQAKLVSNKKPTKNKDIGK